MEQAKHRIDNLGFTPNATGASGSPFAHIAVAPPNAIFLTKALHAADKDPRKMNVGIGAYRTNEGKPYVLSVVRKAEKLVQEDKSLNHEYLPIGGLAAFRKSARKVMFGNSEAVQSGRICTVQSLSGTGSLRLCGEFIAKYLKGRKVFFSNPTWGNHGAVMREAGVETGKYTYWDASARKLNLDGMLKDLRSFPNGSVILLHACAHNPTGVDPTKEQWKAIARVMKEKGHLPMFDSAYQGFATGSLEQDAWAIRYFVDAGFTMLACQSFAKNLGMYNERVGAFHVVCASAAEAKAVESQVLLIVRPMYSNPPAHGARVVDLVVSTPSLFREWQSEMEVMSGRILEMRKQLHAHMMRLKTPGTWEHILTQIGMFSFTGLTVKQSKAMKSERHVYMLDNGRISMAGVTPDNVKWLAESIDWCVRNIN